MATIAASWFVYSVTTPTHTFSIELVNPGIPISSKIEELTGITNEDLTDADTFAQIAPRLRKFIQDNKGDCSEVILAGYNARGYDIPLLTNELLRLEHHDDESLSISDFADRVLDVYLLVRDNDAVWHDAGIVAPDDKGLKSVYHAVYGSFPENLHTAKGDVLAMNGIMNKLDPTYAAALQDHTYLISYENVDIDTLQTLEERKIAETAESKWSVFTLHTFVLSKVLSFLTIFCII